MRRVAYCLILLTSLFQCSQFEEIDGIAFRQYADAVIDFSSQYSSTSWSASRTLGRENVFPNYGDYSNAWAPATSDGNREHIVLGFDTVQSVRIVEIYETYHPGAIDSVFLRNSVSGEWERVYSKPVNTTLPAEARKFTFFLPLETTYMVDAIRIAINSPAVPTWNEIDAVAITGQRSKQD